MQIIHRHGARPPLNKNPTNTSSENNPGILYPGGIDQLSRLGEYVRKTYINGDSDTIIKAMPKEIPQKGDIIARTSNFYRTIISSRAFLDKLYPGQKNLVARVFEDENNDWMLRGYSLCPTLDKRFAEFRESETFKNKEKEKPDGETETNEEFVARVASKFEDFRESENRTSFFNVWAVYDRYLIIENNGYGETNWKSISKKLEDVQKLSEPELSRLKDLADWHETRKFDYGIHNIHLAGGLLRMIMNSARGLRDGIERRSHRMIEYSAHYPTLLTLFGSLRAKNTERNEFPADKIPGFGAAIIFELHKEDNDIYVMKLKWWNGYADRDSTGSEVNFTPFAIGRQPCTNAEQGCPFADMERMLALDDLGEEVFCEECASSANVCKVPRSQEGSGGSSETTETRCATGTKLASGAVGAGAGLLLGVLLALGYFTLNARRKRNRMAMSDREYEMEGDFVG